MENKFRNELEIEVAGTKILLRPTFENIAAMESNVGAVAWLGWKYSRGHGTKDAAKSIPPLTECAKIIYFNQAATDPQDATQKKFNLEQTWDLVLQAGAPVVKDVMTYLARLTAGNKSVDGEAVSEAEKKS